MHGPDIETALDWRGRTVVDRDGEKIGTLKEIYLDESERPAWASVHTRLFGLRQSMVPLGDVQLDGDDVRVPYERGQVSDAPNVDPDVQLTADEEDRLYRHYGAGAATGEEASEYDGVGAAAREEVAPAENDEPTDDAMTRSEEEVRIGKGVRQRERVRLKKYVVTDYVEKKVPVRREEVRLEREPVDEADDERS